MKDERRKHKRFSATAFLNKTVHLTPLPPYFGHAVKGKLIDLSAGGMAILINELVPQETFLNLTITFPDRSAVDSIVKVKRVFPKGRAFLHGLEFLTLSPAMVERIDRMSSDYIDCETRIANQATDVCRTNCAFFTMCTKEQKIDAVLNVDDGLALAFQVLKDPRFDPSSTIR
jgi:hypothetical protein